MPTLLLAFGLRFYFYSEEHLPIHVHVAKYIGINKSLLAKYIYGIKKPSAERLQIIKEAFHLMGKEFIAV